MSFESIGKASEESGESSEDVRPESWVEVLGAHYRLLSREEGLAIARRAEIHATKLSGDKNLSPERLIEAGLEPVVSVEFENGTRWNASRIFGLRGGRTGLVGYIEAEGHIFARPFYRSNSHVLWKYLPQYESAQGKVVWYSKWISESSILVPFPVQRVVDVALSDTEPLELNRPEWILAGLTRKTSELSPTIAGRVQEEPISIERLVKKGEFLHQDFISPEKSRLKDSLVAPDLSKAPLTSWDVHSDLYGLVRMEIFESQDKKLQYLFCVDERGRAWLAGVENKSPVQVVGVRQTWVNPGNFGTPAFQHAAETGEYANRNLKKGGYVDMFKNYLSKIPLLRSYLENLVARTPLHPHHARALSQLVATAQDFGQLRNAIKKIPLIGTNQQNLSGETLAGLLTLVENREIGPEHITTRFGLRKKVRELLK